MKIRIQFAKYGRMLYIGHLDVMRYFQKALRRAGVSLVYTKGYSPHPVLSFASPLGVGIESEAEYADLEVTESVSSDEMVRRLNNVMVPGMEIIDWRLLPDDAPNAMSSVTAADYCLVFRRNAPQGEALSAYLDGLESFLKRKEIIIEKATKKGSRTLDIRPLIYDFCIRRGEEAEIFLEVSAGSTDNLKPELVLLAYHEAAGLPWKEEDFRICRLETYTGTWPHLIPLIEIGERIV